MFKCQTCNETVYYITTQTLLHKILAIAKKEPSQTAFEKTAAAPTTYFLAKLLPMTTLLFKCIKLLDFLDGLLLVLCIITLKQPNQIKQIVTKQGKSNGKGPLPAASLSHSGLSNKTNFLHPPTQSASYLHDAELIIWFYSGIIPSYILK